jgi:hypothetical protein
MNNLRTCTLTQDDQLNFDPVAFTERLREAGFKFDRDTCPVKITKPWDMVKAGDGTLVYRQWD